MRYVLHLVVVSILSLHVLSAQCSDAGVCSIGHRSSAGPSASISVAYIFGSSSELTSHAFEPSVRITLDPSNTLTASLPLSRQLGTLGHISGIGDLTIVWAHSLAAENGLEIGLQVGLKLATADVNAGGLPQAYQSGLGTNDILAGLSVALNAWSFAVGYQHSWQRSANAIDRLRRGGDLLVRAGYSQTVSEIMLTGEILAIKRLQESSVLISPAGQPEIFGALPGSDQFQVNLAVRASYPVSDATSLQVLAAIPTLRRDVNVDGLKRAVVLSLGASFSL